MLGSAVIIGAILLWPSTENEIQDLDQIEATASIKEESFPEQEEKLTTNSLRLNKKPYRNQLSR